MYWRARRDWEARFPDRLKGNRQRVWVLDGGFKQWITDCGTYDPDLVCNYDGEFWDDDYFPLTGREFFYLNDWKPGKHEQ